MPTAHPPRLRRRRLPRRAEAALGLVVGLAAVLLAAWCGCAPAPAQTTKDRPAAKDRAALKEHIPPEVVQLDAFLRRLGLPSLQVRHLERELARPRAAGVTQLIAARLAEVYTERLLELTSPKEIAALKERLDRHLAAYPTADSPGIRLALLEGDFNRAEAVLLRWLGDPSDTAARDDAAARLGKCLPELEKVRDEIVRRSERAESELEAAGSGARGEALDHEIALASQAGARALYFSSWMSIDRNVLVSAGAPAAGGAAPDYGPARLGLRRVLGLGEGTLKNSQFDGVDSEIAARVALGLAIAETIGGSRDDGRTAFAAIHRASAHASVREWADRWEVWALLWSGQGAEAEAKAEPLIAALAPPLTPPKAALCAVLIRGIPAGLVRPVAAPAAPPEDLHRGERIALLGIRGLVKLGRLDLARRFIGARDLSAAAPGGALGKWLKAVPLLHAAELANKPEAYTRAHDAFAEVVAAHDSFEPLVTADAQLASAWCLLRRGDAAHARDAFQKATEALKAQHAPTADAEWLTLLAGWSLAADPPARRLEQVEKEATSFRTRYPDHPAASRVVDLVKHLRAELATPAAAAPAPAPAAPAPAAPIVPPDATPSARLEACRTLHQRWGDLPASERARSPLAASLEKAVTDALAAVTSAADAPGRIDLLLMAADLALAADPPDRARARAALGEAGLLVAKRPPNDPRAAEERFRRLVLARADGDATALADQARWLGEHADLNRHQRAVLTILANQADEAVRAATPVDRKARATAALEAHQKLAVLLGDTPERARTDPALRPVYQRIARLALDAEQPTVALAHLEPLRASAPDDTALLRLAGLAHEAAAQPDRALACWRALAAALPPESAGWSEARYHQIDVLSHTAPPRARRVYDQLQALHPDLGPAPWPVKLRALGARLP